MTPEGRGFYHDIYFPDPERDKDLEPSSNTGLAMRSVAGAVGVRILDLPRELRDQIIRFCLMEGTSICVTCMD